MGQFFQAAAGVLLTVVLCLTLNKQGKDFGILLALAACAMVIALGMRYFEPVLDFLYQLEAIGDLDSSMISILFKVVGIGIVCEIAVMICSDAGNASLGKALHILGNAVILWLSIPIFNALLELIQGILGGI